MADGRIAARPSTADPVRRAALVVAVHGTAMCVLGVLVDPGLLGAHASWCDAWLPWVIGIVALPWQIGLPACVMEIVAAVGMLYGHKVARTYVHAFAAVGMLGRAVLIPIVLLLVWSPLASGSGSASASVSGGHPSAGITSQVFAVIVLSVSFGVVWRLVGRSAVVEGVEARHWLRAQRRYEKLERGQRLSRFWAVWCAGFALVVVVALSVLAGRDVVFCRNDLGTVPEPAGWRSWPILPKLGGFRIKASSDCYGGVCTLSNTKLGTSDLCPPGGLSLDKWFRDRERRSDIALRESHGIYVAAGEKDRSHGPVAPEVFLVAFRRHTTIVHPVFKHAWVMPVSLFLLVVLAFMIAIGRKALLLLRRRHRYRDPALYTPGIRDEAGMITFGDGTRSLVAPGPPGPVLVRLAPAADGGYRVAASAEASEVIEGEVDELCIGLEERAAAIVRKLGRWTFVPVFLVGVFFVVLVFMESL